MAHDVFISYSKKDKPVADAACMRLEGVGVSCWIAPRDVLPGTGYGGAIMAAIRGARVMVLVFSAEANRSPQVLREVERAVNTGVVVVPFRIEDAVPSGDLEYFISAHHWLDALTPPLDAHLDRLVLTIQHLLAPAPRAASADQARGGEQASYAPPPSSSTQAQVTAPEPAKSAAQNRTELHPQAPTAERKGPKHDDVTKPERMAPSNGSTREAPTPPLGTPHELTPTTSSPAQARERNLGSAMAEILPNLIPSKKGLLIISALLAGGLMLIVARLVLETAKDRPVTDTSMTRSTDTSVLTGPEQFIARARPLYGPQSGTVPDIERGVNKFPSHTDVRDFIAEADFYNPSGTQRWSYGFLFRWIGWEYPHYRLFVRSPGDWGFQFIDFADTVPLFQDIAGGRLKGLNLQAEGLNALRIIVKEQAAYFFLNKAFVERVPLTGTPSRGDVLLGVGFMGYGVNGREVRFERFTVSSLDP